MATESLQFIPGSEKCYLFNSNNFFKGFPPQSVVTKHFVENKEACGYKTFPVRDTSAGEYHFMDWDDPEASKIWKAYTDHGVLVEDVKMFSDDEYVRTDDSDKIDKELAEARQERAELFEYYNNAADHAMLDFSSENFEDPLDAFKSMMLNAFVPDAFASRIDEVVHTFINNSEELPTDQSYSDYSTDVAVINLQKLAGAKPIEIKLKRQTSFPLAEKIYDNLLPDQTLKYKLLFLNYLGNIQTEVKNRMYDIRSISQALLLIGQNTIVHMDEYDFEKFVIYYHGSAVSLIRDFQDYIEASTQVKNCFTDPKNLKYLLEKKNTLFTYQSYRDYCDVRSISPEYVPSSPTESTEPIKQHPAVMTVTEHSLVLQCLVSFVYSKFEDKFNPSDSVMKIFFRTANTRDFFRRFRLHFKCVYFTSKYSESLHKDIDKLVFNYLNEAKDFSVVKIYTRDDSELESEDDFEMVNNG